jgi:hypothetical protein
VSIMIVVIKSFALVGNLCVSEEHSSMALQPTLSLVLLCVEVT